MKGCEMGVKQKGQFLTANAVLRANEPAQKGKDQQPELPEPVPPVFSGEQELQEEPAEENRWLVVADPTGIVTRHSNKGNPRLLFCMAGAGKLGTETALVVCPDTEEWDTPQLQDFLRPRLTLKPQTTPPGSCGTEEIHICVQRAQTEGYSVVLACPSENKPLMIGAFCALMQDHDVAMISVPFREETVISGPENPNRIYFCQMRPDWSDVEGTHIL